MTEAAVLTLVELLQRRAGAAQPAGYTFLVDGESDEMKISYAELDRWARAIAVRLQSLGAAGQRVLILYPPGLDYVAAFFGCLYAGAIAVPAYPPDPTRLARTLPRLQAIVKDAQATFALTTGQILSFGPMLFGQAPDLAALTWLGTDDLLAGGEPDRWHSPTLDASTLAFLQYTSGSTGDPKGVMLSHGNLLANERMITQGFGVTTSDLVAGWLPLYHDMGLIGNLLQPLYLGVSCVLMSPIAFLTRPLRWLQMISKYRVTTSGGPNFAYDLCVRKTTPADRATLDLSCWSVAFTGAEPIRPETLDRFTEAFGPCGFKRSAFYPCYGLAEATLLVSGSTREASPVLGTVDAGELERHRVVAGSGDGTRTLVGCGRAILDEQIAIVDPDTRARIGGDRVGEIWVAGAHVAQGYWNRPELSAETFQARLSTGEGPFLRTGDLGFTKDGELFVTGRIKDLIIIRGRNHYPQDLELTVEQAERAVRPGCSAAFSVDVDGEERLVIVCELDAKQQSAPEAIIERIRQSLSESHEVQVHAIALAKSGAVPKTSSGKIQRRACKAAFLEERLDVLRVWRGRSELARETTSPEAAAEAVPKSAPTPFESEVATVVARRLGVSRATIDITQPVTKYGLDSLGAVELAEELERTFGGALPMQTLLSGPSIRDIARELATQKPDPAPAVSTGERNEHALSYGQQSLWVLHQLAPESPAYNVATALRVHSVLDIGALRRSFQRIVLRHAALRTTFPARDGKPSAKVASYKDVDFETFDATAASDEALQQRIAAEANRPFDLAKGPLFRVRVFQHDGGPVLLLTVHHIVVDMWSLIIIGDELGKLYREETGGDDAGLAPLRAQFADQVRAEQQMLSAEGNKREVYWKERLAGELPVLAMPLDRPRPAMQTFRGATLRFAIAPALVERLKAIGKTKGATLYMTLLAAYYALLQKHTGQTDIIVGSPTRGRGKPELRDVIGYFVNMMPLRVDVTPDQTFAALLTQVRKLTLAGFANSDYPFFAMVDRFQRVRDPRHSPIFQTAFTFQKAQGDEAAGMTALAMSEPGTVIGLGALSLEAVAIQQGLSQFDLALTVGETASGLAADLEYNADLFDASTIERLIEHYRILLEAIAEDDERPLAELTILTQAERHRLVVEWNDTKRDFAIDTYLHALIEEQVERSPDAVAVEETGLRLTYRELDTQANRLANHLRGLGVGPDVLVGICAERSVVTVVGVLAILKAGGAYVPLDPAYPTHRLRELVDDARPAVVLVDAAGRRALADGPARLVALDQTYPGPATQPVVDGLTPRHLAYVIYTSGSTGKPKGVMIEHRSVVNDIRWQVGAFEFGTHDAVLGHTSISFDASIWELWTPLTIGARLVLLPRGADGDVATIARTIQQSKITIAQFVPTLLRAMTQQSETPWTVDFLVSGGEALDAALAASARRFARRAFVNIYGPTEATVDATSWSVPSGEVPSVIPIGRPIANTQAYVLDARREVVPIGVAGELYLGGVGIARGYLHRTELTAERFVPDPFGAGRLYRTGDLVAWSASGDLQYLGRIDHQVKLRGFRIELGEIESVLGAHPAVREAVVLAREDRPGDRRLVAYVVGNVGSPDVNTLRASLEAALPAYMVPSAFVVLQALPLTPNGKLDRKALPVPDMAAMLERTYVAPRTPTEELLAGIWAQVLRVDRVGAEDDFFAIGGHSLLATQVVARVRQALGVELPLRTMFEAPTVAELARLVENLRRTPAPAMMRVPRGETIELSFAQQRLWFLDQLEPNSSLYNIAGAARLLGALDTEALRRSLNTVVARHEVLRTTFTVRDGKPSQEIAASLEVALPVVQVSGFGEAQQLAVAEAHRPFDLTAGPLVRARVLRLSSEEHWLLLSIHHIVSDGWSLGVLMDEVATFYAGGNLPELAVQYADFAAWQRVRLSGSVLDEQLSYWKKQLAGIPSVHELPTDRPRPPTISYRGAAREFNVPRDLTAGLENVARASSVTLFMTLLAAFQTLLHRYSRQDDIVVGSPVAGRTQAETEGLIGFFVNTVVMRTDLSGTPTFRELLVRVRDVALGAYAHQEVPFEKLVEELQPERNPSHSPLFQVMFALQNTPAPRALPSIDQDLVELGTTTSKFDLTLSLEQTPNGLTGSFEYNTDLFEASTIERMSGHFSALLQAVADDAGTRIGELSMLTERERHQILVEWNDTARPYPHTARIESLVTALAESTPEAIALEHGAETLTYSELDAKANGLASLLRARGVAPGALVAVHLERSFDLVISYLAIWKCGAAYLPIAPDLGAERIAFMIGDAQVPFLVTTSSLASPLTVEAALIMLDREQRGGRRMPPVVEDLTADAMAYVIYTSGSTGRPKGSIVSHRSLANLVAWSKHAYPCPSGARAPQLAGLSFDAAVFEIWLTLCGGGTLCLVDDELRSDPVALRDWFVEKRISNGWVPTALAEPMLQLAWPPGTALRILSTGGERLASRPPPGLPFVLLNLYGPTECTVMCSGGPVPVASGGRDRAPDLGTPIDNAQIYLLEPSGQLAPVGVPGELAIGGACVGDGYLHRPELSAEKFVANPFGPGRLYRSGDLARWLPGGTIEYIGRIDQQVKIRGFRIELGEIEVVLGRHPDVREVAVLAREDAGGMKRLVAYIVGRRGAIEAAELRSFLKGELPEYMVPSAFVTLDSLPLTPNGKVDRRALPEPDLTSGRTYVAPRTPTERVLAALWAEVLRVERVGAEDNFFELGGHSLLATQVVSRVRQELGVELPLRSLFESPTLEALARALESSQTTPSAAITPVARDRDLELSFAQQRLWFLDQLAPNTALYSIAGAARLLGPLDVTALARALNEIVARHESLRTTFVMRGDQPVQVIAPSLELALPVVDSVSFDEAKSLAVNETQRPFELARGPLFRALLLRRGEGDHWLVLTIHHIISDGWSMSVLMNELATLYAGGELAPLAIQYADFSAWQRSWLTGGVLDTQLTYWKAQLSGLPELLELPADRPRPPVMSHRGRTRTFHLSSALTQSLETLGNQRSATLFMTMLAAFQTLLHRYSRQDDITVGSPVANRNRAETEGLIGFFVNTLVMRTDLSGNPTFGELLARVREVALGAYGHQDVPFEKLVEELRPGRNLSHTPLFQVMFVLQNTPPARSIPGIEQRAIDLDSGTSKFDLTLALDAAGAGLAGSFEFNTDIFDAATVDRMIGHFEAMLESIVADPERRIGDLVLLTGREREQLLVEWNATELEYPHEATVHDLLDAQVDRTPDAVALQFEGTRLTYREVDQRANQLAHRLRELGVGPDRLVAIFCERSIEMAIAMIAVHKAGGAYVPLDPNYPKDRIEFIQEDTACSVMLTQERLVDRLPANSATIIRLDADWPAIARLPSTRPPRTASADSLSHIIYTSGSTGRPKGVAIEHHSVVSFCYWAKEAFTGAQRDGVLFSTSICFDLSVYELFATLAWGGRVVLVENALSLLSLPPDANVRLVNSVPSIIATVLKSGVLPASVETINLAGEPLKSELVDRIYNIETVRDVYDLYGPSETTTYSTYTRRVAGGHYTIGRPLANTQVYLVDQYLQLVPRGVAGEICIGGAGVARGYLGRPDLTAEKFVELPVAQGRVYRTGDLGRWLPDGTLAYVGRIDHQVKIRGFRIELGEIEAALLKQGSLREAVVLAREDVPGDKRLVAYVVGRGGAPDIDALRVELRTKLPDYMLPGAFVALDEMPLTPNGKIDRKALPAPSWGAGTQRIYVAPRSTTEQIIAGIWADLLQVEKVGMLDNFFELGGHSLLATQVASRLRHAFNVELPLRSVFEATDVAALARTIDSTRRTPAPPIVPVSRDGDLELSFAQQRLWFLDQLEPNSSFYNVPTAITLRGELDVAALARSLDTIVARHEALRTTFLTVDGQPRQVIASSIKLELPVLDVSSRERAHELVMAEAAEPFDLARGPLVRARLLRLDATEHWLLLTMHHINSDGWSLEVVMNELATLYGGDELPPLAIQYADFAAWQRAWLSGGVLDEQLAYWNKQLTGMPSLLELPTDRPRPPVLSYRGATYTFPIRPALREALSTFSREQSVTLFMTMLAAFQTLLHRYSRQEDIAVGSPVANRNRAETEALVGFFVNTLVLRTNLSGNPTFIELVGRVREVALAAYSHQDVPFEKLVEELQPERNLSYSPLFQVMFTLQDTLERELPGLQHAAIVLDTASSKFDLTLEIDQTPDGLVGQIEYSTELFDAATIARMAVHYETLLEAIVADPNRRLGELTLLTAREQQQILVEWNDTTRPYAKDKCLHELVEAQVDRTPDAIAVVLDSAQLTYRELDTRANQLAHHLIALGVAPETRVGICIGRSIDMMIGLLGILKAGAAYLPLDPEYPDDRIAFVLEDAAVPVLITEERLASKLAPFGAKLVRLDTDRGAIAKEASHRPAARAAPENLAYVIYTSGSTGRPKGVLIEHRMVVNLVLGYGQLEGLSPADRSLQFSSIAFDGSVNELFAPFVFGATNVLRGDDVPTPAELLGDRFKGVTVFNMATAYWHALATALQDGDLKIPAALRLLNMGGERALPERVAAWHKLAPHCVLQNVYGPAETTDITTVWPLRINELVPGREVPIGVPLPNYTVYLLDAYRQPVPVGIPGEVYIGGVSVARGYLNRPELTAERFVSNPFAPGRMYRTGDYARWFPNGNLEFIGRVDHQVKIRGFRIELGEIEAAIAEHPQVRSVVVLAREDSPGDKRLVAYIVGKEGAVEAADLKVFLRAKLPDYMVPFAFISLDELPLTTNGKVDVKALPAPDRAGSADSYVEPRTPAEKMLASIWAEVLKLERVGAEDDFFDLGGHSLLATQVVSRIRTAFKVELPLRSMFESRTIADLAKAIDAAARGVAAPPIERVSRDGDLELSFAQQRLWFLDQLDPGSTAYNMSGAIRLEGALDAAALARALDAVVARHEALRTTLASRAGRPFQVIVKSLRIDMPVIDVASREAAHALALADTRQPFDLERGPLLRARLLRLGKEEHWLILSMHHIVSDLWSMVVLMEELTMLYGGIELPPLKVQYADFAAWQRTWLAGGILEQQLTYWKKQLAGAPGQLELPTDRPRPPVFSGRGSTEYFKLSSKLARKLNALSREHSATLFMTMLAAFQTLLHRYCRQDDIVVGSPVANRNRAETESLIGFFVNTLVLRTDLSGNPTFRELVKRVREVALGAYGHQDVPFERIVEELHPERNLSHTPLFQVLFALENAQPAAELPGLIRTPVALDSATAKFDLTLIMEEQPDGLVGSLEYSTDLFEASTIQRMIGHFETLLEAITADANQRIDELPLMSEAERQQLLIQWNDTARAYPNDKAIHELFEAQVDVRPDATALVLDTERLTYGELDRRSNQLAHRLRRLGVVPEMLVAMCVERSFDMLVGILGILKAGGAYLPLDLTYPADRVAFMLEDAAVSVIVTQEALVGSLPAHGAHVICLDTEAPEIASESTARPEVRIDPENLAYVIYTSGSTGRPKGVQITHGNVTRLMDATHAWYGFDETDAWTLFHSYAFDFSVWEIWGALIYGGRLVIVPYLVSRSPEAFRALLAEQQITVLNQTPSAFYQLVDADTRATTPIALRYVIFGGEALSFHKLKPWFDRYGDRKPALVNMYGITETTVHVTYRPVAGVEATPGASSAIGVPIPDLQLYVLDQHLAPVPFGVVGELFVGGAGLARGYLNRPGLTAERFIPNPYGAGRLYKTGDLARRMSNGSLDYIGRSDHQVKIRGFRIELGEIEAVVAAVPGVREVVVIVREDVKGDKRIVAYLVGNEQLPAARELRTHLMDKLPEYMMPSAFVVLDTIPLNANGKVDRQQLPAPDRAAADLEQAYAPPRTQTELALVQIFQQLLRVGQVGISDDFFLLGGHSLLSIQLCAAIQTRIGVALPLATLFRARTVEALAREVDEKSATSSSNLVTLRREGDGIPVVLIHPVGGTVFCYLDLVGRLAPGRPCYALQATGLVEGEAPVQTVAEMARLYVDLLVEQLGGGPCHLAGWSFGGLVAQEMARLLTVEGKQVVSTTLVDTWAPSKMVQKKLDPIAVLAWFARDMGLDLAEGELDGLDRDQALTHVVDRASKAALLPGHLGVAELGRFLRVFETNLAAGEQHKLQVFGGDVTLFRASQTGPQLDPSHGFRPFVAGTLKTRTTPGDHYSMLKPPLVDALASAFDEVLAGFEAQTSPLKAT